MEITRRTIDRRAASPASLWDEARHNVPALQGFAAMMSAEDLAAFGESYKGIVEEHSTPAENGIAIEVEYALIVAYR